MKRTLSCGLLAVAFALMGSPPGSAAEPPPVSAPPVRLAQEAPAQPAVRVPGIRALAISVVPDLTGRSVAEAQELLEKSGLKLGEVGRVASRQAQGTVVRQSPAARDTAVRGSAVSIWIADAPRVRVPDLSKRQVKEAETILARARLRLGEVTIVPSDVPEGTVLRQSPSAGESVEPGSPVSLGVARAPAPTVPDVVGRTLREAGAILAKSGFGMREAGEEESRVPEGSVARQSPGPGEELPRGSAVRVWVAALPLVTVPELRGLSATDADQRLRRNRLRLGAQSTQPSLPPAGEVVGQKPSAGEKLKAGSAVDVALGDGSQARVPALVGQGEGDAREALERAALRPGRVTARESARPEGEVLDQRPAAGSLVARGNGVDYTVAAPQTVAVPGIVGSPAGEALAQLERLTLAGERRGAEESSRPEGEVLRQDPAPGTRVRRGTRVGFWVATPALATVPDLRGLPERQAAERLGAAGLGAARVEIRESPEPEGSVIEQDPPPGARVSPGTGVNFRVAAAPRVEVPALVGAGVEASRTRLSALGLRLLPQAPETDDSPEGSILAQEPAPGTRVLPGSPITVRVSAGPPPVWPWIAGSAAALALLGGAGWGWARRPKSPPSSPARKPTVQVRLTQPEAAVPDGLPLDPEAPEVRLRTRLVAGESAVSAERLVLREERRKP